MGEFDPFGVVSKCAAAPIRSRRTSGWAVNIGGAQGGGEPLDAVRTPDLWEAFDLLRARVAELERERDQRESKRTSLFCTSMRTWAQAIEDEHGGDPEWRGAIEAIRFTFRAITKSALLDRLIYGGEELRTEKCPEHKGKWSGLPSRPNQCTHGCGLTGWLPNRSLTPSELAAAEARRQQPTPLPSGKKE